MVGGFSWITLRIFWETMWSMSQNCSTYRHLSFGWGWSCPWSINSYASRLCKCLWMPLGKEEERPRSLRWEDVTCLLQLPVNSGGLRSKGRQSTASANEVLVIDALYIWFCNQVGEICQMIKINICNVDNKNSSHLGKYLQYARYHVRLARLLLILSSDSSNSPMR